MAGRYPFVSFLNKYLDGIRPYYAPSTYNEMDRKLHYLGRVVRDLRARGLLDTTNPTKFGQAEVGRLLDWMNARDGVRAEPLAPATQEKHLVLLGNFLKALGNPVLLEMKAKRLLRMPAGHAGPLESPSEGEVVEIVRRVQEVATAGDQESLGIFGMTVFAAYAGVRLKEVRLAKLGDFALPRWELTVFHPKGEGAYASPRKARVAPPGRPAVEAFLSLRSEALRRAEIDDSRDLPLVPFIRAAGGVSHWKDGNLHKVKVDVTRRAGVRYDFRSLRRSFGQCALDRGARYDTVSVLLGHKTTRTTETYYARRKFDHAAEELDRVWS